MNSHLKVHLMVSWSMFHCASRWLCRPLHQAAPGFPAVENSPRGSPSATSLPVELSLVWHQPELLRALTLTHLQRQPLGQHWPAAGVAGGVQLPWVAEGPGGVAEVGAPRTKQGSRQRHWDDQVEVLGLKCREYELDRKHNLQPTQEVTFLLPRLWTECMLSEQRKEAPSRRMGNGGCINDQSATVVSSCETLSLINYPSPSSSPWLG